MKIAPEDVAAVQAIIAGGQDRALLKLLREETTFCVLMVRIENEKRKAEWARRDAERQAEERLVSETLALDGFFDEAEDLNKGDD
jgi:hypothetical protein